MFFHFAKANYWCVVTKLSSDPYTQGHNNVRGLEKEIKLDICNIIYIYIIQSMIPYRRQIKIVRVTQLTDH